MGLKDSFLEPDTQGASRGKNRVFSFGRKMLPPENKEDVYDRVTEYNTRKGRKMNRVGNDPFLVVSAQIGKSVRIEGQSVVVEMDDDSLWNASIRLFGSEYIQDSTRAIFYDVDPEVLESLRDYPAGHC